MTVQKKWPRVLAVIVLIVVCIYIIFPIYIVVMNSFKSKLYISSDPFSLPDQETFTGLLNYTSGLAKTGFFSAFAYSLWITVSSVVFIILCTSMLAWYITRVHGRMTTAIYYALVFSMIVPFQMVMYPMSKFADMIHINNPVGIIILYVGFGAGTATFMFSGFIKSIPVALEEAASIDGSGPVSTFFRIVFPMLTPTTITIAILETMWVWNDYLMPYLVIGTEYRTIPVAIQYLRGGYGSVDMGAMMAMLFLAMLPVIVFYLCCQKYIISGVTAGAVKA